MIDNYARVTILKPLSKKSTRISQVVDAHQRGVCILSVASGSSLIPMGGVYDGSYDVEPSFETQTLPTAGYMMEQDVTVAPIGVSITSNLSGGNTVYIGPF